MKKFQQNVFGLILTAGLALFGNSVLAKSPEADLRAEFNVRNLEVVDLELPATAGDVVIVTIPYAGEPVTLTLIPQTVRATSFRLLLQLEDGSIVEHPTGPVKTLRGSVNEIPGSIAAGSLRADGLHARIILPDGEEIWIEPSGTPVQGAAGVAHVMYHQSDVFPSGGTCKALGDGSVPADDHLHLEEQGSIDDGGVAGGSFFLTELACEADVEYFQDMGSNIQETQDEIENIINVMNLQYEQEVTISHLITGIFIRTAEPDPYTSNDAETLLNQFRAVWLSNPPLDVSHDVAQLFTGRNILGDGGSSGVIGIAWLSGVCNSQGYSVVENCCSSLACLTDLSAHELGHNWSATHCTCAGWTMNPSLTCSNNFQPTTSIPLITSFRDSRTCLNFNDTLLRILISGPTQVPESTTVHYTATAQFLLGPDTDVTNLSTWSVNPPNAGSIVNGHLTAANVNGNLAASVSATYSDVTGFDIDTRNITIIDADEPDPRSVRFELVPQGDISELCAGATFVADMVMSAPNGNVSDVRLLQLDAGESQGVTIESVQWGFENLLNSSFYLTFQNGSVYSATYVGQNAIPGLVLNLTATPQVVGQVVATANASGVLSMCGDPLPPVTDQSFRVLSGFNEIAEFSQALENVECVGQVVSIGASVLEVVTTVPANNAIDARQPSNINGSNPTGWLTIDLNFNCNAPSWTAGDFVVSLDPPGIVPTIGTVTANGNTLTIEFDEPIPPGHWTTLTMLPLGMSTRVGFLPGDVNGDRLTSPVDILKLIDHLNGVVTYPVERTDIDRSGATNPADILRVIDLLNGADAFAAWNGASLP